MSFCVRELRQRRHLASIRPARPLVKHKILSVMCLGGGDFNYRASDFNYYITVPATWFKWLKHNNDCFDIISLKKFKISLIMIFV